MRHISRVLLFSYFVICFVFLFSTSASAYIDPSTTTYIIQAVAGIAIAIGAFVVVFWRRAKKKVKKALNIDEGKAKEEEEQLVVSADILKNEDNKEE